MADSVFHRSMRSVLTALAVILLLAGALLSYTSHAVFQEEGFAERAALSLQDRRVSSYAATEIADAVIRENRDLMAVRPLLLGSVEAVISSGAAQPVVRTAARAVHRLLFTETGTDILFTLDDINILVRSTLEQTHPSIAERIPERLSVRLQERFELAEPPGPIAQRIREARRVGVWGVVLLVVGGVLLILTTFLTMRLSRGFIRLGVVLGACAVSLWLVRQLGGHLLAPLGREAELSATIVGLWDTFMAGLRGWTMAFGGLGLVLMALPFGVTFKAESRSTIHDLWVWLSRTPEESTMRGSRAFVLLLLGVLLVLSPGRMVSIVAAVAGASFAFVGLVELFAVAMLHASGVHRLSSNELIAQVRSQLQVGVTILAVAAGALGFVAFATFQVPAGVHYPGPACNGMVELCDVPLDEAVFATTHNSMAAADQPGWLILNQERGIERQLEDGVRGLTIDVYYGYPTQNQILTELQDEVWTPDGYERVVGREGLEAALRIRRRLLGAPRGRRGLYLCHGFCEMGATPLGDGLQPITRFLDRNPREVLVIVVEDNAAIDPEDFARAVNDAGLLEHVYRGPITAPWPTLGEMIESGERVLIGAEVESGDVPWYHSVYEGLIQETPYHFESAPEFSCEPHRGRDRGALFLLNHWITAPPVPLPSRAEIVNSEPFLMSRIRQCENERGRLPNLVSVDFYRTGDLFEVVRRLNREVVERRRISGR